MKEFYEGYWSSPKPSPVGDSLSAFRRRLIWQHVGEAILRPARVLEIGCGDGDLAGEAILRGDAAVGGDLSEVAVARARERYPKGVVLAFSAEEQPWSVDPSSYNLVVSLEVVEHLVRPRQLIRAAHEALRPGGYLVLSTPYHGLVKNVALALRGFQRHFDTEGGHVRFFTDKGLLRLLTEEWFSVVARAHLGRAPLVWANTLLVGRKLA